MATQTTQTAQTAAKKRTKKSSHTDRLLVEFTKYIYLAIGDIRASWEGEIFYPEAVYHNATSFCTTPKAKKHIIILGSKPRQYILGIYQKYISELRQITPGVYDELKKLADAAETEIGEDALIIVIERVIANAEDAGILGPTVNTYRDPEGLIQAFTTANSQHIKDASSRSTIAGAIDKFLRILAVEIAIDLWYNPRTISCEYLCAWLAKKGLDGSIIQDIYGLETIKAPKERVKKPKKAKETVAAADITATSSAAAEQSGAEQNVTAADTAADTAEDAAETSDYSEPEDDIED